MPEAVPIRALLPDRKWVRCSMRWASSRSLVPLDLKKAICLQVSLSMSRIARPARTSRWEDDDGFVLRQQFAGARVKLDDTPDLRRQEGDARQGPCRA